MGSAAFESRTSSRSRTMRCSLAFLVVGSAFVPSSSALPVADAINQDIQMDNALIAEEDELAGEEVKGEVVRFMDDMELGGLQQAPAISGRTLSGMANLGGLKADRVIETPRMLQSMDKEDTMPRAEEVTEMPAADRVMGGEQEGSKPGGDGKMKLNLNLKDLDGNPSDLTVGAAAVGLMHNAVKSKGPDDSQVNAIAGFGHQIMQLVDEIEKEKAEDKA